MAFLDSLPAERVGRGRTPGPFPRDLPRSERRGGAGGMRRDTTLLALSGPRRLSTGPQVIWLDQNPYYMVEGESFGFVITFNGVTTVTSPSNTLYLDGTDVSSTSLSGSASASGNVAVTKIVGTVTGPNRYILAVVATCDTTQKYIKKLLIIVRDPSDEFGGSCWIREGPQWMVAGEDMVYAITLQGASSISGTPTAKCYRDGTDVSSTNLSGSCSVSGLTITLPIVTAVTTGRYVVAVTASVDGRTEIHKLLILAQNAEDEF